VAESEDAFWEDLNTRVFTRLAGADDEARILLFIDFVEAAAGHPSNARQRGGRSGSGAAELSAEGRAEACAANAIRLLAEAKVSKAVAALSAAPMAPNTPETVSMLEAVLPRAEVPLDFAPIRALVPDRVDVPVVDEHMVTSALAERSRD